MSNVFTVLILVCSAAVSPQDCSTENAIDVIRGPSAANEIACARDSQAYLAQAPFVVLGESYPKILCSRSAVARDRAETAAIAAPTRVTPVGTERR